MNIDGTGMEKDQAEVLIKMYARRIQSFLS